jgi:hypothetical protein
MRNICMYNAHHHSLQWMECTDYEGTIDYTPRYSVLKVKQMVCYRSLVWSEAHALLLLYSENAPK